jgi:hypothetical protein
MSDTDEWLSLQNDFFFEHMILFLVREHLLESKPLPVFFRRSESTMNAQLIIECEGTTSNVLRPSLDCPLSDFRRKCQQGFHYSPRSSLHLWKDNELVIETGRTVRDIIRPGAAMSSLRLCPDCYHLDSPWGQDILLLNPESSVAVLLDQIPQVFRRNRSNPSTSAQGQQWDNSKPGENEQAFEGRIFHDDESEPISLSVSPLPGTEVLTNRRVSSRFSMGIKRSAEYVPFHPYLSLLNQGGHPGVALVVRRKLDWPVGLMLSTVVSCLGGLLGWFLATVCFR